MTLALAWFLVLPLASLSDARRHTWRRFIFQRWSRLCLACLSVRVTVRGSPPREACFLVSNHLSYLDIFVLGSRLDAVFVSALEVANYPFFGLMARSLGTIFIDRAKKRDIPAVNRQMQAWLEKGYVIVLFPEGTSSRGDRVHAFRPSLLEPAARSERPLAVATVRYTTTPPDAPASQSVCSVSQSFLAHALGLLRLKRVVATLTFGGELACNADRKSLAEILRARVEQNFAPLE